MVIKYRINERYFRDRSKKRIAEGLTVKSIRHESAFTNPLFSRYSQLINPHRGTFIIATSRHGIHKLRVVPVRQCSSTIFLSAGSLSLCAIGGGPVIISTSVSLKP